MKFSIKYFRDKKYKLGFFHLKGAKMAWRKQLIHVSNWYGRLPLKPANYHFIRRIRPWTGGP